MVEDLITVLQNPHPPTQFLQRGNLTNDAICQLQIISNVLNSNNDTNNNNNNNRPNNPLGTDQSGPRVNNRINNHNNARRPRVPITPQTYNTCNDNTNGISKVI